jgi:hypothetical protein
MVASQCAVATNAVQHLRAIADMPTMHIRVSAFLFAAVLLQGSSATAQFRPPDPPAPGEQYHVEFGAVRWSPEPGIVLATDGLAASGLNGVDFVREFGFATKRFTEFRGVFKAGKHKIRYGKVPVAYVESVQLERPLVYGGRTFGPGFDATADLHWDLWRYGYEFDFLAKPRGFLGVIAEIQHSRVKADLSAREGDSSVATLSEVSAPIPTIGVAFRIYPHRLVGVGMELSGIKVPGFVKDRLPDDLEVDGSVSDFDVYGTLSVTRYFGFQGGYRRLATDYVVDGGSGDLSLKGFYAGAVVRF